MCLLCSACSVYYHISCKKRVHCSLEGKMGEGGYTAAMFLKKCYKFEVLLEERGIISVETFCILYDMIKIPEYQVKSSTWYRSIRFLVAINPRPQPRGESLVTIGKSLELHYFLGRIFHPPITLQKTPFVIPTLEPLPLQHDDSNFLPRKKLVISSQLQAMNLLWSPGY